MRRLIAVALLTCGLPWTLPASEFDWMVREFSRQSGTSPVHIPFFGLARLVIGVAHPAGASDLRLAVFEHPNMMGADFSHIADSVTGSNWKPIIRVHSRGGEATSIYLQPDGKKVKVLIATIDKGDATFVEVHLKPEALMRFVDEHRH